MKIYEQIKAVVARRGGETYVHDFEGRRPVIGLEDGSIYVPATKKHKLWGTDRDGTPWLINPELAIFANPPRKGGKKAMARRLPPRHRSGPKKGQFKRRAGGSRRRRTTKRRTKRRRYRRNPGYAMRANPPRRRRRQTGFRLGRWLVFPPLTQVAGGVAGMALSRMAPGWIGRFLPMLPQTGVPGLAVRAVTGIILGQLVGNFMSRQAGKDVAFGALLSVADDAAQQFIYPAIGIPGMMGAYLDPPVGAFLQPQVGQYLTPGAQVPQMGSVYDNQDIYPASVGRLNAGNRL